MILCGAVLCFTSIPQKGIALPSAPSQQETIAATANQDSAKEQDNTTSQKPGSDSGINEEVDEPIPAISEKAKADPNAAMELAWQMLETAVSSEKPQNRIDGLTAIGTLKGSTHTEGILRKALGDTDKDVRVAAVVACANLRDHALIPDLRNALDDRAAEVSFASAVALWKLNDRSGENILYSVLAGERKASSGFLSSGLHQANKDLHNPSTLAMIGAQQGAYAMLGPFGIGLDAYKIMRKGNTANSARVLAVNLLADEPTQQTKEELIAALKDKDYFVRGASAKALGNFHGKDVSTALLESFGDQKTAVRYVAAAAYIRVATVQTKAHGTRGKHLAVPGKNH
jgi:hypothetical protein